jgi:hypothetical protein
MAPFHLKKRSAVRILIRTGFKTFPQAQYLCCVGAFNPRNVSYIPVFQRLMAPYSLDLEPD